MKNFQNLKAILEDKGELKTKELKELGYSPYDLNLFMNANLLIKKSRGVYTLPVQDDKVEEKNNIVDESEKTLFREGIYYLKKRKEDKAFECFSKMVEINPNHSYGYLILAYLLAKQKKYDESVIYIEKSYKTTNKDASYLYFITYLLSYFTTVPSELLNSLKEKANEECSKTKSYKSRIYDYLEKRQFKKAAGVTREMILKNCAKKIYNIGLFFIKDLITDIMIKENNEVIEDVKEEKSKEEPPLKETIVVPQINEEQIVTNAILLDCINNGNYEEARELLKDNAVEDQKDIIDILLSKLIAVQENIYSSVPQKVVASEEIDIKKGTTREDKMPNIASNTENKESIEVQTEITAEKEENETNIVCDKEINESLENKIKHAYEEFKKQRENYQFDEARKYLFRYEYLSRQSGQNRNIKYHYDRLDMLKKEYLENPEKFKKRCETLKIIKELCSTNQYEEALLLLDEVIESYPDDYILIILKARIYNELERYKDAYNILLPFSEICEEPDFFYQMAQAAKNIWKTEIALENCIKYNERRPKCTASVYLLMADCYKRLCKPSKELKCLRTADEINKTQGHNCDLSGRISKTTHTANINREIILAKINNKEIDYD